MTEPNDIPAILARAKHWLPRPIADADIQVGPGAGCSYCRDGYGEHEATCLRPIEARDAQSMAAEILSLRAQLAALEKDTLRLNDYSTNAHRNIKCGTEGWVYWIPNQGWSMPMPFRDAYDRYAELSRREKENG